MYKYGKIVAFFSTIAWLAFIFSAFKGFHFWYAGFTLFFWLTLASLNYRHRTSLWFLKNKLYRFLIFYFHIVLLSFFADFFIGQKLTNFWQYPFYNSLTDWLRLYFIIYPFGCVAVLELAYLLSQIFKEPFLFVKKSLTPVHKFIDWLDVIWVYVIYATVFTSPLFLIYGPSAGYKNFVFWLALAWPVLATIKLRYHISHWLHWLVIFIATLIISVFLHELPNVGVFEWKYGDMPVFNFYILGIPFWVVVGWYVIVLGTFRLWLYLALEKEQK